jgi:hypothetical protein
MIRSMTVEVICSNCSVIGIDVGNSVKIRHSARSLNLWRTGHI